MSDGNSKLVVMGAPSTVLRARTWQPGEPPHDRPVVMVGNVVGVDGAGSYLLPISGQAIWDSLLDQWVSNGKTICRSLEEKVVVHAWIDLPESDVPRVPKAWPETSDKAPVNLGAELRLIAACAGVEVAINAVQMENEINRRGAVDAELTALMAELLRIRAALENAAIAIEQLRGKGAR